MKLFKTLFSKKELEVPAINESQQMTDDYADSMAKTLSEVDWEDYEITLNYMQDVLDFMVEGEKSIDGKWQVTRYKLLLGWGGPNVWLFVDNEGEADLKVRWAESSADRYIGEMRHLLEFLNEMNEMNESKDKK